MKNIYNRIIEIRNLITELPKNQFSFTHLKENIETAPKPNQQLRLWVFLLSDKKFKECTELKQLRREFFKFYEDKILELHGYQKIKIEKKKRTQFLEFIYKMKKKEKLFTDLTDTLFLRILHRGFHTGYKLNSLIKKFRDIKM